MPNEAIRSIRALFLSSLLIILLWVLTWPSAQQKFREYQDARDLHAWLYLKDRMEVFAWAERPAREVEQGLDPAADPVDEDCSEGDEPGLVCMPLEIEATWPDIVKYSLVLYPKIVEGHGRDGERFLRVYAFEKPSAGLPFNQYEVVVINEQDALVVPYGDRELYDALEGFARLEDHRAAAIRARQASVPGSWDRATLYLAKHGFRQHPLSLKLDEPAVAKFAAESDPRVLTIQVFGMPLRIGLFLSAVGLLLTAIAFAMLGPILALRRSPDVEVALPWIFVAPTGGSVTSNILEVILLAISGAWIAAPLLLLYLQLTPGFEFQGTERLFFVLGMAGLVFSSIVYLIVSTALWRLRRNR